MSTTTDVTDSPGRTDTEIDTDTDDADIETTVLVQPTGLLKADRYVADYDAIVRAVLAGLAGIEAMVGPVETIVTRGNQTIQERLAEAAAADVEFASFNWIGFLNDEADGDVPAVKQADQPDLAIDDPAAIDWPAVDDARVQRSKAKANGKLNHCLFDPYYDDFADVDAVVLLHDGSHRGIPALRDARGVNDWVDGSAGHVDQVIDLNCQDAVLYARHLLDGDLDVDDLHETQVEALHDALDADALESYGISAGG